MRPLMIALAFLAGFFLSARVEAQRLNVDRDTLFKELKKSMGEEPVALGLTQNGGILELLTTPDGATWTLILTMPDGTSYFVVAGRDWNSTPIKKGTAL